VRYNVTWLTTGTMWRPGGRDEVGVEWRGVRMRQMTDRHSSQFVFRSTARLIGAGEIILATSVLATSVLRPALS
jgi:hypothetical protein